MGLVKRVPVYQAQSGSNPMKGDRSHPGKGNLVQQNPSFQANSGKDMIGDVHVGSRTAKSKKGSREGVMKTKQKAGLTNQGYGI